MPSGTEMNVPFSALSHGSTRTERPLSKELQNFKNQHKETDFSLQMQQEQFVFKGLQNVGPPLSNTKEIIGNFSVYRKLEKHK